MCIRDRTIDNESPTAGIFYKGKSLDLKEASSELIVIFTLALVSAYLVMAGTFNAWRQPFVVMLTVPLAALGGLIFILLFFINPMKSQNLDLVNPSKNIGNNNNDDTLLKKGLALDWLLVAIGTSTLPIPTPLFGIVGVGSMIIEYLVIVL